MELVIRPEDLNAASASLAACSARLDAAALTFSQQAQAALPDVGANAAVAASRGSAAALRAVQILSTDVERLAHAVAVLAQHYPRVDTTAMPPP